MSTRSLPRVTRLARVHLGHLPLVAFSYGLPTGPEPGAEERAQCRDSFSFPVVAEVNVLAGKETAYVQVQVYCIFFLHTRTWVHTYYGGPT